MAKYCLESDVKRYLPRAVVIEGDNPTPNPRNPMPETLTMGNLNDFIMDACSYIDAELGSIYITPLHKTNMDGRAVFPPPIPSIAARIAAKFIWEERLSGSDRQSGEFIDNHYQQALRELNGVVTGSRRLLGQSGQLGSRFARSAWYGIPPSPAKEIPDKP